MKEEDIELVHKWKFIMRHNKDLPCLKCLDHKIWACMKAKDQGGCLDFKFYVDPKARKKHENIEASPSGAPDI